MRTQYICNLPIEAQKGIKQALIKTGLDMDDIDNAMDSRLIDLENTIDITPYL